MTVRLSIWRLARVGGTAAARLNDIIGRGNPIAQFGHTLERPNKEGSEGEAGARFQVQTQRYIFFGRISDTNEG